MKSDIELIEQFKRHYNMGAAGLSRQYDNTRMCQAFYSGDFMSYTDTVQFNTAQGKRRAMVQFNKIKPYVNAVKGFFAQNRRRAKYQARMTATVVQTAYSVYCNALAEAVRDMANANQIETQQDGDMLINGYGAIETAITYTVGQSTTDANGQILKGRLDPLRVWWDATATAPNLLDSRFMGYSCDYALDDALELFDDSKETDFDSAGVKPEEQSYEVKQRGGEYTATRQIIMPEWVDEKNRMVRVHFYQWMEYKNFYRAQNPIFTLTNPAAIQLAGMQLDAIAQEFADDTDDGSFGFDPRAETLVFDDEIKARLLEHFGEFITIYPGKRKVYYTAVLSGQKVFTKYRNLCQKGFTVKFKTGDYDAKNKIWVGMVNSMRDPVLYYNKALTELMFIIGANSKGGVMYEKGSVEDIADFEQKYAKTDANVEVEEGALSGGKIREKRSPFQPTGYENIIGLADSSINDVNGIDRAFLGSSESAQETGILYKRRIQQVVATLACYADAITLYQKEDARMMLDFLRVYAENNEGGTFRIIGDDGRQEFVQISADKLAPDYDVVIEEAPQLPEERAEQANIMVTIGDKLMAAGDAVTAKTVYAMALKYMNLENADQQQLQKLLIPQDKQIDPAYVQQLEQQVQALMTEVNQADVKRKLSEVALNTAKLDQVAAETHRTMAEANRVQEQAVQTHLENKLVNRTAQVNVNI